MKKILIILLLGTALTHSAYAGFSVGMPGAVIKRVKNLDDKVKNKKLSEGWVLVPGNLSFGTSNFHVMAYEAKNMSGLPASQAGGIPWVNIDHPSAVAACSALGGGAHLVTITEAQTINRNIESQPINWANGVVGSLVSAGGGLKRGNIGITDSASYNGANSESGSSRNPKAKLVLSNGGELWDWSGNVWEWIYGTGVNGTLDTPNGVAFDTCYVWCQWDSTGSPDLNQERLVLGPSNSTWTDVNGVGRYYSGGAISNAVLRGGGWGDATFSGVFSIIADYTPSMMDVDIGFRCAK